MGKPGERAQQNKEANAAAGKAKAPAPEAAKTPKMKEVKPGSLMARVQEALKQAVEPGGGLYTDPAQIVKGGDLYYDASDPEITKPIEEIALYKAQQKIGAQLTGESDADYMKRLEPTRTEIEVAERTKREDAYLKARKRIEKANYVRDYVLPADANGKVMKTKIGSDGKPISEQVDVNDDIEDLLTYQPDTKLTAEFENHLEGQKVRMAAGKVIKVMSEKVKIDPKTGKETTGAKPDPVVARLITLRALMERIDPDLPEEKKRMAQDHLTAFMYLALKDNPDLLAELPEADRKEINTILDLRKPAAGGGTQSPYENLAAQANRDFVAMASTGLGAHANIETSDIMTIVCDAYEFKGKTELDGNGRTVLSAQMKKIMYDQGITDAEPLVIALTEGNRVEGFAHDFFGSEPDYLDKPDAVKTTAARAVTAVREDLNDTGPIGPMFLPGAEFHLGGMIDIIKKKKASLGKAAIPPLFMLLLTNLDKLLNEGMVDARQGQQGG